MPDVNIAPSDLRRLLRAKDKRTIERPDGAQLIAEATGVGPVVLLVMGTGSPGRVWNTYQVPALVAAGYQPVTYTSRGISPSTDNGGAGTEFTIGDLVNDALAVADAFSPHQPIAVIGTSLGARIAEELTARHPERIRATVALAAHGRLDGLREASLKADISLHDSGIALPPEYRAVRIVEANVSPQSLATEQSLRDWLAITQMSVVPTTAGMRAQWVAQLDWSQPDGTYQQLLSSVSTPLLAVGFADDRVIPPYFAREVAQWTPGARYVEIPDTGHFGYIERPDAVNTEIMKFFSDAAMASQ